VQIRIGGHQRVPAEEHIGEESCRQGQEEAPDHNDLGPTYASVLFGHTLDPVPTSGVPGTAGASGSSIADIHPIANGGSGTRRPPR
jgi:hypothetical protein